MDEIRLNKSPFRAAESEVTGAENHGPKCEASFIWFFLKFNAVQQYIFPPQVNITRAGKPHPPCDNGAEFEKEFDAAYSIEVTQSVLLTCLSGTAGVPSNLSLLFWRSGSLTLATLLKQNSSEVSKFLSFRGLYLDHQLFVLELEIVLEAGS